MTEPKATADGDASGVDGRADPKVDAIALGLALWPAASDALTPLGVGDAVHETSIAAASTPDKDASNLTPGAKPALDSGGPRQSPFVVRSHDSLSLLGG